MVGVNVSGLERMAALHDVLNLALHLADVQTGDGELLLELADSVHVQLEVQLGASDGGADLGQVAQQIRQKLGDTLALVCRQVAELLKL